MKKILFIIILIAGFQHVDAQPYRSSVGLRAGVSPGVTFKGFMSGNEALEGILSTRFDGVNITVLYEWHAPLGEVPNFFWYFGGGGHIGSWKSDRYVKDPLVDSYFVLGVDGILGMEYTFEEIPLNLSLDWKPAFNLIEYSYFVYDELALSARYIISGHKTIGSRRR